MRKIIPILMVSILLAVPLILALSSMGVEKLKINDITWNAKEQGFEFDMSVLCGIAIASEHASFNYSIELEIKDADSGKDLPGLSLSGKLSEGSYVPLEGINMECNLSVTPPFQYDTKPRKVQVSANAYLIGPSGKIIMDEDTTYTKVINVTALDIPCEACPSD